MKRIITAILIAQTFSAASEDMPKTSAEALARCEAMNARLGIVEDCTQTDFVYRTLKDREPPARVEANSRPTQVSDDMPKTSAEALAQCKAHNLRFGIVEDCTKTDFVYKTMKEVEAYRAKQAKAAAAHKARQARPGVSIGMTQAQVLNETNWGKPERVNRTTTAAGTREQWVYGNGNYLYFHNGTLTSIQN
ncbi:MAG: hypothetical protein HZA63_14945 [Rhodocyclales bacterium]|nr:hypothetical protein [Rhodocyclales bacterium]